MRTLGIVTWAALLMSAAALVITLYHYHNGGGHVHLGAMPAQPPPATIRLPGGIVVSAPDHVATAQSEPLA